MKNTKMTTDLEAMPQAPLDPLQHRHDEMVVHEMEAAHDDGSFAQIVEDMGISPETQADPSVRAVLELVADCWAASADMPRAEATAEREWLVEVALRAAGADSEFVRRNGLVEYLPPEQYYGVARHIVETHEGSEQSARLRAAVPEIAEEFKLVQRFGGAELPDLPVAVFPDKAPDEQEEQRRKLFDGAGALVTLAEHEHAFVVQEMSYDSIVERRAHGSRAFMAHELAHSLRNLMIGEGPHVLGVMFNELLAEWAGGWINGYDTEKNMTNLLSAAGFDVHDDYLPGLASGEISVPQFIGALREQFGSRNALRLLVYAPENYHFPGREQPSVLVQDCIEYAVQHGRTTVAGIESYIQAKYQPRKASIMLTNREIRPVVPPVLYPMILAQARLNPDFDESRIAPVVPL